MNPEMFCTHIEKAYADVRGAYPMINREFAANALSQYKYINREDDTGSEGLRKAKLSYCPDILLEKYMASGEAKTISEALDYLKNELEPKIYFSNLETHQTLLQREKNYLKNVNQNLINRIKKEEEVYG